MKSFAVAFATLLSSFAFAQSPFQGSWTGVGGDITMLVNGASVGTAPCNEFQFQIKQTAEQLDLESVYMWCGHAMEIDFSMTNMTVKNGELFWEGKKNGTVSSNLIHIDHIEDGSHLIADFKLIDANTISYHYDWTDGLNQLVINGTVKNEAARREKVEAPVMFCQFWNSITHAPQSYTLHGVFEAGAARAEKCFSEGPLGFCMNFTRSNVQNPEPEYFSVVLTREMSGGMVKVLNRYERKLSSEPLENMVLTASAGDDMYSSALCSPQN